MIQSRTKSKFLFEFCPLSFNHSSDIGNNSCNLCKVNQILFLLTVYMHFWKNIDLDMWSSFKPRIDNQILNGHSINRYCFFHIPAVIANHIVKYCIHVLTEQVFVIFLKIEGILILIINLWILLTNLLNGIDQTIFLVMFTLFRYPRRYAVHTL